MAASHTGRLAGSTELWAAVYRAMPNLEDVNFINATRAGLPVHWEQLGMGAAAMVLWSALFVGGATLLFARREI
jgi:hypothetical protein